MKIFPVTEATPAIVDAVKTLLGDLSSRQLEFTLQDLQNIVCAPLTTLYIAEDEATREVVGMFTLAACQLPTGTKVWLEDVVVSHTRQGQGLGRALLAHAVSEARLHHPGSTLMLTSRPSRLAANHLYADIMLPKDTNVYKLDL